MGRYVAATGSLLLYHGIPEIASGAFPQPLGGRVSALLAVIPCFCLCHSFKLFALQYSYPRVLAIGLIFNVFEVLCVDETDDPSEEIVVELGII